MRDIYTLYAPDDSQRGIKVDDFSLGWERVWASASFNPLDSISWPEDFKNEFIKWSKSIFVVAPPPPDSKNRYSHGDILRSWKFPSFEILVNEKSLSSIFPSWIINTDPRAEELEKLWKNSTITNNLTARQKRDILMEIAEIYHPYREITAPQNLVGLSLYDVYLAYRMIIKMPTVRWKTSSAINYNHEQEVAKSELIKRTYYTIKDWIENRQGITPPSMSIDENFTDFYSWALFELKPRYQWYKRKRDAETGPEIPGIQWSQNALQNITEIDESYLPEDVADNYQFIDLVSSSVGPDRDDYIESDGLEIDESAWEEAWDEYDWGEDYADYPLELRLAVMSILRNIRNLTTTEALSWGLKEEFREDFSEITNDWVMGLFRNWEQDFNGTTKKNWSFQVCEPDEALTLLNLNYEFSSNSVSISYNLPEPQPNEIYVLLRAEEEGDVFLKYKYSHELSFQVMFPFINYIAHTPKYL